MFILIYLISSFITTFLLHMFGNIKSAHKKIKCKKVRHGVINHFGNMLLLRNKRFNRWRLTLHCIRPHHTNVPPYFILYLMNKAVLSLLNSLVCVCACVQLLAVSSKLQSTQTHPHAAEGELPLLWLASCANMCVRACACVSVPVCACVFGWVAHHLTHVHLHTLSKFICEKDQWLLFSRF